MKKKSPTIDIERFRERLKAAKLTHIKLAEIIGDTQGAISSIKAGKSKRPKKLREIAEALSTSQEYLLGETDDPAPAPPLTDFLQVWDSLDANEKEQLVAFGRGLASSKRPHKE